MSNSKKMKKIHRKGECKQMGAVVSILKYQPDVTPPTQCNNKKIARSFYVPTEDEEKTLNKLSQKKEGFELLKGDE